jgi:two-component system chemotaxis sensor kinase CheA
MSGNAIRDTFFEECEELLEALVEGLAQMEERPGEVEVVNAVFRAVHSIKGGAGAFGLDRLVGFTHTLETVMDRLREGAARSDETLMALLHRAGDQLSDLVAAARDGSDLEAGTETALLAELEAYTGGAETEEEAEAAFSFEPLALEVAQPFAELPGAPERRLYSIRFTPTRALYDNGHEPLLIFDALAELGSLRVEADLSGLPDFDRFDPSDAVLGWRLWLTSRESETVLHEVFEFVEGLCTLDIAVAEAPPEDAGAEDPAPSPPADPAPEPEHPATAAAAPREPRGPKPTLRVDLDRVDRLINTVGELIINQAMIAQRIEELDLPTVAHLTNELEAYKLLARDIQEGVMAIRAQPVKPLFQRMSRIVREATDATGKKAKLVCVGDSTEVDKTVIERLADPLTHMIRNAIDHGLEAPQERIAAGKPETGMIRLTAAHRSGSVCLEISDDGAGLDRARIRAKAVEKKLIAPGADLTDPEIDSLLFLPGFSTAGQISSLSGRGVGMDVVKNAVQALGGRVSIHSTPGQGTSFTIILPLTLAVMDGFVISVARETMVIPIASILETIRPNPRDIHAVGTDSTVVDVRGAYVPVVDVADSLDLPEPAPRGPGILLLVNTEMQGLTALRVSAIHDQRQVVIKSLESNYAAIPGVSAATILGDGKIALILDPEEVIRLAHGGAPEAGPPPPIRLELRHA